MHKHLLIYIIFLLTIFNANAQSEEYYYGSNNVQTNDSEQESILRKYTKDKDKINYSIRTGSSFSSFNGNSLFSSYIAPEVNIGITNRLSISAGEMITYGNVPSFMQWYENSTSSSFNKMANYYMYAKGEYLVNNNLILKAGGVFEVNSTTSNLSFSTVGFDLKIGKATISADINFINSNNSIFLYPYGGYGVGFHNPILSDPFIPWQ